ncbi:hypothetical protein TIFTF001_031653 [Ficus carica]|uniref:Uncharacterized protein n=1 Tax=Ficus carica TaxID=3494 RepID=A0AA88DXV3_FICCA|nr:hypothetical protein TIFTF001_031653 [Ficus carica]
MRWLLCWQRTVSGPDEIWWLPVRQPTSRGQLPVGNRAISCQNLGYNCWYHGGYQIDVGVTQLFLPKVTIGGREAINSFKHHTLQDSRIHPKHYSFGPLLPYEFVNALNGRARAVLRSPSHIHRLPSSSMFLHHSPLLRKMHPPGRTHGDLNLVPSALIPINVRVTQPFFPKVATDGKCAINSFKHHSLPDSGIYFKHYAFGPLLREVPYEFVGAPNGQARALLRDPSYIGCLPNSSMLLH